MKDVPVSTAMLADRMGWSRQKAHRELLAIDRAFPGVVRRRGKGGYLWAYASQLAAHIPGLRETPLEREVRILREQQAELTQRLDIEVATNLEFRRKAAEWYGRVIKPGVRKA